MNKHYILRFHPEVEGDLQKVYTWYEEKLIGLGDDFLQIFYSSTKLIIVNPYQYSIIYSNYRRYLLQKFPYALYYIIEDNMVIVIGLFHHARDPRGIKSTLNNRTD